MGQGYLTRLGWGRGREWGIDLFQRTQLFSHPLAALACGQPMNETGRGETTGCLQDANSA